MMWHRGLWILAALSLLACDETEECVELRRIKDKNAKLLERAQRRVQQGEKIEARMARAKEKAEDVLAGMGVDLAEDDIHAMLEKRAKEQGATVERGTRDLDPVDSSGQPGTETQWTFRYEAKSPVEAFATAEDLMKMPPFVRLVGLYPEKGLGWRLETVRGIVDRAPMKIDPTPLPKLEDASGVASEFGFCGASDLRGELADIEKKYAEAKTAAEQMTVNLPLAASWEGLWRRAEVIRDIEQESRRITNAVVAATSKVGAPLRAIGVERDIVIVEMKGNAKTRGKVEQALPRDVVERAQPAETDGADFVRMMILNRTAEKKREAEAKMKKIISGAQKKKKEE